MLNNQLSDTVNETLYLYSQGQVIDAIAQQRELHTSTIYSHLATAIEARLLDAREVLSLEEQQYNDIVNAIPIHISGTGD